MSPLVLQPTPAAQWAALLEEAQQVTTRHLKDDLASYLLLVLMRFMSQPEMAGRVLALDYLEGLNASGSARLDRLRDVGDLCLLYSGLFPQRAKHRRVRLGYYVDMGRTAYLEVAGQVRGAAADLFGRLAHGFVSLMDVLQATRTVNGAASVMTPLDAFELWEDTASPGARQALRAVTTATPLISPRPSTRH